MITLVAFFKLFLYQVGFIRRDSGVGIQSCPGPDQTLNGRTRLSFIEKFFLLLFNSFNTIIFLFIAGIQPKPCQTFLITSSPGKYIKSLLAGRNKKKWNCFAGGASLLHSLFV